MTAANEGLDLTPQDLYETPTVAALAKALIADTQRAGWRVSRQRRSSIPLFRRTSHTSSSMGYGRLVGGAFP